VFNVYESLLVEPPPDKPITVSLLENPQITAVGKVREVTPAVAANTGTVQVKIALDALPKGMQLGSVVSATANGPAKASIELPWAALTKDISAPAVWLIDGDGKAQLHKVTVARYLTGKVIISDGLKGGEKVVVAGGQLLHPGMIVEIAQPPDQAQAQGVQP
jgi:RND family efflux transporter MFP subunit